MAILQYKCLDCLSFFDHLFGELLPKPSCLSCSSFNVDRNFDMPFYPNKLFCPHDRDLEKENLESNLLEMSKSRDFVSLRCGAGSCVSSSKKSSCNGSCSKCL